MSEESGGLGPPDPFNLYNLIHREEMPTLESTTKKNYKALKHAYFTHPSDAEKYFVISGEHIRQMDVFDIAEGLNLICKDEFKKVIRLNSGDLLVQTRDVRQINSLKTTSTFGTKKCSVSISENGVLNQSHAIIRCREIMGVKVERIIENLSEYNVIGVQRLKKRIGNTWIDTPTHVLTFNSTIIPAEIRVGYLYVKTEIFIPAPFRCSSCQKMGHTKKRCDSKKNKPKCGFCAEDAHLYGPCLPPKCVNCHGPHPSSRKNCPKYLEEREINAIRVTLRIPYKLAREEYNSRRGIKPVRPNTLSSQTHHDNSSSLSFSEIVKSSQKPEEPEVNLNHLNDIKKSCNPRKSQKITNPTLMKNKISKVTNKEFKRNIQINKLEQAIANPEKNFATQNDPTKIIKSNYNVHNETAFQKIFHKDQSNSQLEQQSLAIDDIQAHCSSHLIPETGLLLPSSSPSPSSSFPYLPQEPEPPDIDVSSLSDDDINSMQ